MTAVTFSSEPRRILQNRISREFLNLAALFPRMTVDGKFLFLRRNAMKKAVFALVLSAPHLRTVSIRGPKRLQSRCQVLAGSRRNS